MPTVPQLGWPLVAGLALVCAVGCSSSSADGTSKHSDRGAKTVTVTTSTQSGAPASAGYDPDATAKSALQRRRWIPLRRLRNAERQHQMFRDIGPNWRGVNRVRDRKRAEPSATVESLHVRRPDRSSSSAHRRRRLRVPYRRIARSCGQSTRQIPVVAYGAVWHGFGVFCISQETGLTCINRDGHGFFASRERWRMF